MKGVYTFELQGIIKPYVRMTQRGKFVKPEALAYLENQRAIRAALQVQIIGYPELPLSKRPLAVFIELWRPHLHTRDADNEIKALLDAMNGIVYDDDRWVDLIHYQRRMEPDAGVLITVREG